MNSLGELQRGGDFDIGYFVPPGPFFLRAGAAGAMVAGGWTAFSDILRVRDQEITSREAISHVVRNAALGAGAGVLIGAAAHLARAYPVTGVAAVLAVGAGALYLAGRTRTQSDQAASPSPSESA
jgi:ABC-type Mn2+/Zn2+ transport system permease subunit